MTSVGEHAGPSCAEFDLCRSARSEILNIVDAEHDLEHRAQGDERGPGVRILEAFAGR